MKKKQPHKRQRKRYKREEYWERVLQDLRDYHGQTDEEVITAAKAGTLRLDADRCMWLILLDRGDLI